MSRTVLAKVEGFTPVIDSIVKDTGSYMTALVFGRIWRYCQMKDGVCNATLETIADGLEMSRTTVMNHAKKLVELEYLEDRTPGLKNHPHTYADTGKAGLQVGVSAKSHVNVVDVDVNVVDTHVNLTHLKKVVKKEKETDTADIFKTFENNISMLTPMISNRVGDAIDTYPHQWILDAIEESVTHNARNWAYIEKILKTWKAKGRSDTPLEKMGEVEKEMMRMDLKSSADTIAELGIGDVSPEEQKERNAKFLRKG